MENELQAVTVRQGAHGAGPGGAGERELTAVTRMGLAGQEGAGDSH